MTVAKVTLAAALGLLCCAPIFKATAQDKPDRAHQILLEAFDRGRSLARSCEYAVADPSAYGSCNSEVIWRCHTNRTGCLNAVPPGVLQGSEFEKFTAEFKVRPLSSIPMDIDRDIGRIFGNSIQRYCAFWRVPCDDLMMWYKDPKFAKMRNLTPNGR